MTSKISPLYNLEKNLDQKFQNGVHKVTAQHLQGVVFKKA